MKRLFWCSPCPLRCGLAAPSRTAAGEDLVQIYREALVSDPTLAAARATWLATQEALPQARAGLLPVFSRSAPPTGRLQRKNAHRPADRPFNHVPLRPLHGVGEPAAVPRAEQDRLRPGEAAGRSERIRARLGAAGPDRARRAGLFRRAARAVQRSSSRSARRPRSAKTSRRRSAISRSARRRSPTPTRRRPSSTRSSRRKSRPGTISRTRSPALRAIIGRTPKELKTRRKRAATPQPPTPNALEPWVDKALGENYQVRIAQSNYDIAALEVDRQRAGHYPTLDLVASYNQTYAGGGRRTAPPTSRATRASIIGVQLNVPIYQGGFVDSRVRQAIANQDAARQNLEIARRAAQLLAQTRLPGVTSGVAQVKALEPGGQVGAGRLRIESKLGQEVGVRTNLDVLNKQQKVFQARLDLAQAYYKLHRRRVAAQAGGGDADRPGPREVNRRLHKDDARRQLRGEPAPQALPGTAMRGAKRVRRLAHLAGAAKGRRGARRPPRPARSRRPPATPRPLPSPPPRLRKIERVRARTTSGSASAIGSIRFWPPSGSRLPPTNATSAAA